VRGARAAAKRDHENRAVSAPARVYLALGSNLGDREGTLQRALDAIAGTRGVDGVAVSNVYETDPVGGPEQGPFLNAVVALDTAMTPRTLLELAHRVEAEAHRVRLERWGPRTLDVDVLLVGDETVDEPDLVVPHPRMWERGFVLAPLHDVAPDLVEVPADGWPGVRTVGALLSVRTKEPRPT
jgi:2-amino-4-hydroxy-6-hydroxymethyldihydropteridine diphosphokinase